MQYLTLSKSFIIHRLLLHFNILHDYDSYESFNAISCSIAQDWRNHLMFLNIL